MVMSKSDFIIFIYLLISSHAHIQKLLITIKNVESKSMDRYSRMRTSLKTALNVLNVQSYIINQLVNRQANCLMTGGAYLT